MVKDPYQALGVARTADESTIKRAFRKLTQQHHPDRNPGDKAAEDRFKEVSQAYEILGDADKRKLFDEFGEASLTQGFDPERARAYTHARPSGFSSSADFSPGGFHFDDIGSARATSFDDLLSRLFGGGKVADAGAPFGRGPGTDPRRGPDIEGEINVDFLDALDGVTVPLRVESQAGGARTLDVKVPPGIADGGKLRLRGQGGNGSPRGDILLTVRVKPHPKWRREGNNLRLLGLPVTALEAYRGGAIDVPSPWGTLAVKLKPGSQSGQTLRLRGQGVRRTGKDAGDLLVTLEVRMPPPGDDDLTQALERLQGGLNVREAMNV
ncbi:MAG: J domain-containing protein [Myxococcales bacterium FL481]|nr:MAG: J domain-containing protein [Myxococcales bacterium FL481]